jgi:fatty-acid peroxygenase
VPDGFIRKRALPLRVQKTLVGRGGVQTLDGEPHRHRKQMFMSMMTQEGIAELARITRLHWSGHLLRWASSESIVLFPEVGEILFRSVCEWCGVPVDEGDVGSRTRDMEAMIDAPGAVGPRHIRGRRSRSRSGKWIGGLVIMPAIAAPANGSPRS